MKKPEPPKPTIADIAQFPNIMDEESRRIEAGWNVYSMLGAIGRIKKNAKSLLHDPELLAGAKADPPEVYATYVLKDCRAALRRIKDLEVACENADIRAAAEAAFRLGAIDQRMVNRVIYDKHIRQARESKRGLAAGRTKKAQKTAVRRKEIAAAVKKRMKNHPKDTISYAREIVAKELELSPRTVRTATLGLKMSRKKME